MMGKQMTTGGKSSGVPPWVWVLVGIGVLAMIAAGSFLGYRMLRGPMGTEPLPATAQLPPLPRPELPEGQPLPESPQMPPLPEAPGLPQAETSERPSLPEGPPLPEAEAEPEREPEPSGPSGIIYYAATVHPYQINVPVAPRKPGMQFVTAMFRIVNKSTVNVHVEHNLTALQYQGQTYYPYVWASGMDAVSGRRFLSPVTLAPNSMTEGYVGFEIPQDATGVEPLFMPQGVPGEIKVVRVPMEQIPTPSGPAPTQTLQ